MLCILFYRRLSLSRLTVSFADVVFSVVQVRVWDVVRSQSEIQSSMNRNDVLGHADLMHLYRCDFVS